MRHLQRRLLQGSAWIWLLRVAWRRRRMPFDVLVRSLEGESSAGPTGVPAVSIHDMVFGALRIWPGRRSCLTASLAAVGMLRRHGHDARLVIGVREARPRLDAHAWVEVAGKPVGAGAGDYTPLRSSSSTTQRAAADALPTPSRTESR